MSLTTQSGPDELLRLKSQNLLPAVYHFYREPPQLVGAAGAVLFDHEDRAYIDCLAGVGVMNAGHCQPAIIEPAIEQIRTLQHTTTIFLTEPQLRLAQRLTEIAPRGLTRSFFCASGSEAVECALNAARVYTGRPKIVAFQNSLHGRTRDAMNVTGLPMWRSDPFPADDVIRLPFGNVHALERALHQEQNSVAAVLGELVQGNGGIIVPTDDWWPTVRNLCTQHGVLLILDEVQTGFNRTGRWFACEHWNVAPDLFAISKGLGNGFPIAACMTTEAVGSTLTKPAASTYGGNPVCAVAALATIDYHLEFHLGARAHSLGAKFMRQLAAIADRMFQVVDAPRGMGLMCGLPVRATHSATAAQRCDAMLEVMKNEGVLAGKTGGDRNVLTFLPPLVITEQQLVKVCNAVEVAAARLQSEM